MMTNDEVIVLTPEELKGTLAIQTGERFRYPGQNFWVYPVKINGKPTLVTSITTKDDYMKTTKTTAAKTARKPAKKAEKPSMPLPALAKEITLSLDPYIVYDYQHLLATGHCPSCGHKLQWHIVTQITKDDDKFCSSECCGLRFSMVPESVRVLSVPISAYTESDEDADEDFLKELRNIQ